MVRFLISVAVGWSKNGVSQCRVSVSFNKMVPIKKGTPSILNLNLDIELRKCQFVLCKIFQLVQDSSTTYFFIFKVKLGSEFVNS